MTVTEKGYCHDPATGTLQEDHQGVIADLTQPQAPHTVPGILVEALRRRRESQIAPFTILCCDNLPANGKTVARVISRYASLINADLGSYVESEVACPSTMVDRIVPATTAEDKEAIQNELGLEDAWPVSAEPFTQWVIEDRFSSGRPRLEDSGAQLVTDVGPYELMKLRLLNGSHSALAYLGYLAGCETIADVMADPSFARFTQTFMDDEVTPTLQVPPRVDLGSYKRSLLARFSNTALHHRTWQIAMDGSQKLPQRLLGTVRDRLATGAPIPHLALGIAAWMRYVSGVDERGHHIDVRDPLSNRLRSLSDMAGGSPEGLARGLLSVHEIFGDLAMDPRFVRGVTHALNAHFRLGARGAVEAVHSM
jgi:fructuronate reductase